MINYKDCPLCSSSDISLHLKCKDHFISGEEFSLFKCNACGFIFTQNHPDENSIAKYYQSDDYISHSDSSKGLLNKLYKLVRDLMLRRKTSHIQNATGLKTGKLLDIGCGTGYFAGAMKAAGWEVKGIEPDEKAGKLAASLFGFTVIGPDQISSLPSKTFDCITLWHVLEHFNDPVKYFSEISRLLKPGGLCVVALPNSRSYDAEYYGRFWAAYDVPRHLWHYEPGTFKSFLEKVGFKCFQTINLPFDVFYISILSEKYKGSAQPFIKGMIRGKLYFLRSLFNLEKSSSIIYFLRESTGQ
jgi:2-polyprenyl-3-methyl-5-hydroxy-6-metoxy-1,4-benzoquinol methylase